MQNRVEIHLRLNRVLYDKNDSLNRVSYDPHFNDLFPVEFLSYNLRAFRIIALFGIVKMRDESRIKEYDIHDCR